MLSASLSVARFRLTLLRLHVTRRCFVSFGPVSALYKTNASVRFERCLVVRTVHSDCKRTAAISYAAACAFLSGAVLVPAFGMMFYYRRERHKLSNIYQDDMVYQTPFVDAKSGFLVQQNGIWFPVALFPNLQRFEQIRRFTLNDDDILIVSFPKSGNI